VYSILRGMGVGARKEHNRRTARAPAVSRSTVVVQVRNTETG
jgi:hypothetical protein